MGKNGGLEVERGKMEFWSILPREIPGPHGGRLRLSGGRHVCNSAGPKKISYLFGFLTPFLGGACDTVGRTGCFLECWFAFCVCVCKM